MKLNITMASGARYMDNVRIFMRGIRLGWRMVRDVMVYKDAWRMEELEAGMTLLEKTTEILKEVMNGICGWLVLTMETELMFDGTLPTLDLQIWVNSDNIISYKYYEKPTTPTTVLHARSAIPEATRRATLNQEMIRRMTNTSEVVDDKVRVEIVDDYAKKLVNSEYDVNSTRGFIIGGLKGYERLLSLSKDRKNPKWKPLHLAASWNSKARRVTKMLSKTTWFKEKGKEVIRTPAAASTSEKSDDQEPPSNHHAADEETSNGEEMSSSHQGGTKWGSDYKAPNGGSDDDAPSTSQGRPNHQGEMNKKKNKKKRGADREYITLGGLKRIEVASKRRAMQKLNRKLGKMDLPSNREKKVKWKKKGPPPTTISVCFIDNTAGGLLLKRMKGVEEEVANKVDYRVRMMEAAGTPMSLILTKNNPWGTKDCTREDCTTCAQGDENMIDCKKINVLYESYCTLCNPGEVKRGKKDEITFLREGNGIYVGESSRSLYERTREHVADRLSRKEDSHQIKHWLLDHGDLQEPPEFKFRLIRSFKDPMSR